MATKQEDRVLCIRFREGDLARIDRAAAADGWYTRSVWIRHIALRHVGLPCVPERSPSSISPLANQICIRFKTEHYHTLLEAAKRDERDISTWVRIVVLHRVAQFEKGKGTNGYDQTTSRVDVRYRSTRRMSVVGEPGRADTGKK